MEFIIRHRAAHCIVFHHIVPWHAKEDSYEVASAAGLGGLFTLQYSMVMATTLQLYRTELLLTSIQVVTLVWLTHEKSLCGCFVWRRQIIGIPRHTVRETHAVPP